MSAAQKNPERQLWTKPIIRIDGVEVDYKWAEFELPPDPRPAAHRSDRAARDARSRHAQEVHKRVVRDTGEDDGAGMIDSRITCMCPVCSDLKHEDQRLALASRRKLLRRGVLNATTCQWMAEVATRSGVIQPPAPIDPRELLRSGPV